MGSSGIHRTIMMHFWVQGITGVLNRKESRNWYVAFSVLICLTLLFRQTNIRTLLDLVYLL